MILIAHRPQGEKVHLVRGGLLPFRQYMLIERQAGWAGLGIITKTAKLSAEPTLSLRYGAFLGQSVFKENLMKSK